MSTQRKFFMTTDRLFLYENVNKFNDDSLHSMSLAYSIGPEHAVYINQIAFFFFSTSSLRLII